MLSLLKGKFKVRLAETGSDMEAVLSLRALVFRGSFCANDSDALDEICNHLIVEDCETNRIVATLRLLPLQNGSEIFRSYAAQYYDLSKLTAYQGKMAELGRLCIDPNVDHPDVLRIVWGAIAQFVDDNSIELLLGCSSFPGTEAREYVDTFSILDESHIAPDCWLPIVKAPQVFEFKDIGNFKPDHKTGLRMMPPLLKTYLTIGGWVSDHAVIDRDLGTLHVFTGVEIRSIPPARAKALRAVSR